MVVWESLDALSHQLELCRVGTESAVVVVMDTLLDADRVALIRAAVARTGADAIEVRPLHTSAGAGLLSASMSGADLVIVAGDPITGHPITGHPITGHPITGHTATDGSLGDCQVLYLADLDPRGFRPNAGLRRRVTALQQFIQGASRLSLADAHGTDLVIELSDCSVNADHGLVDDDTPRAQFPAGWVAVTPPQASVNGQIVVMPGDTNLGARRMIASPVALQFVADHVATISGESPDADVLRALFEYPDDPNAYGMAEFSIGLNPIGPAATAFDDRLLDPTVGRLLAGVVTLSIGENLLADRPCAQRVTMSLPGRSVQVDDLPVVVGGRLEGDYAPDVYEL